MSLEEYSRKRHFDRTPEPKPTQPATPAEAAKPRFFIQRHNASHLHYDFRLEIDGTLKSWAVPKGPTQDPAPKRFAAMVEDHPISYGDFEGNIPAGNYGGGSVMLWDRGTFELIGDTPPLEQIARGDLKFRLSGEKLKGEFALVHIKGKPGSKGNDWLLLKKKDSEARPGWDVEEYARSVKTGRTQEEIARDLPSEAPEPVSRDLSKIPGAKRSPMPGLLTPMSAILGSDPPRGPQWTLEVKWDGIRALCYLKTGTLEIYTRSGNRCERQYPELSALPHNISCREAILDGEIAILDAQGVSRFALIQPRIMNTDAQTVAHLAKRQPATLFLFDILYLDGYDLRGVELQHRKELLESVLSPSPFIRYSESFPNDEGQFLDLAREQGLEGLIAKCATSIYQHRRTADWVKLKLVSQQEFVIAGFTEGERDYFGALVLGLHEDKKLVHAGNVGTGFDRKKMASLSERMRPLITPKSPLSGKPKVPARGTTWIRPELVAQVKFANWTPDGHLRAPVFLGLREDVNPEECVRESSAPEEAPPLPAAPAKPKKTKRQPLLPGTAEEVRLEIDGNPIKFTHLNKIFFPGEGYTKRHLLNFYNDVAPLLLPHLKDRPLSLKRYPNGITEKWFFQKDSPASYPNWLRFVEIFSEHRDVKKPAGNIRFVLAENTAALLFLVQQGCIDQNPWQSRVGSLENPDFILIDLDPQNCEYSMIVEAALLVRRTLDRLELEGYPKTTGGHGMHIYIPVVPEYSYDVTRTFAEAISHVCVAERPDLFTTPRSVQKREKNKVYFDYLQNGEGKTIAAPYVVRAHPGAPVATPLAWREIKPGLSPAQFHISNSMARFDKVGDLFAGVLEKKQELLPAFEKLQALTKR